MISNVQSSSIPAPSSASFSFLLPLNVQAGDAVVFFLAWIGTMTFTSITNDQGDTFVVLESDSFTSGTQKNTAIVACLNSTGSDPTPTYTINFSSSPGTFSGEVVDLNGATFSIIKDPTASAAAHFVGGTATATPNISITVANQFEELLTLVFAPTSASMSTSAGWTNLLSGNTFGVFYKNLATVTGAMSASPCTLSGATIASSMLIIGLAAPTQVVVGFVPPPLFPDTFPPRLADYLYDSLQGDPTFVVDPYGPRPFLFT